MKAGTSRGRDDATLDFGECELGVLFSNDDVAIKDDLGSSTESPAIHCRDDWFVEGVSSGERAETMGHADQFLLIVGDLNAEAGIVSFKPPEDNGESCQGGHAVDEKLYSLRQICTSAEDFTVAGEDRYPEPCVRSARRHPKVDEKRTNSHHWPGTNSVEALSLPPFP
jgi:hypothetical protein